MTNSSDFFRTLAYQINQEGIFALTHSCKNDTVLNPVRMAKALGIGRNPIHTKSQTK